MKKLLVIVAVVLAAVYPTLAQTSNPVSSALRDILPGRQKNIIAAVEDLPADKFNYKPTADQMTFGHLVTHIIESNITFCGKVAGVPAPKVEEAKESDGKDKLLSALKASFEFCSDALGKMDDSKLNETTEAFGGQQVSRARLALALAGSWADHYGMAAMYLRFNGLTPPSAKK
jgi:uncharacterized damage-inducible protein DinB